MGEVMSEETITKRLHISGLTPAITPADLSQKLQSFGTVKALDGFGTTDALGEPRKFGYVTIETTKVKLARCMNVLSGVTWKGAKLRIGEAKPDFRERLLQEHLSAGDEEPPRKRRRLPRGVQGVHASDMTLVTPENVLERSGWRVTPLGRLIRPIRMRPTHPLPEPLVVASKRKSADKQKKSAGKVKKTRARDAPTRARRRTIDPTKWGSQHLKGAYIESGVTLGQELALAVSPLEGQAEGDTATEEDQDESLRNGASRYNAPQPGSARSDSQTPQVSPPAVGLPTMAKSYPVAVATEKSAQAGTQYSDLRQEKDASLGLLKALFGDKGDDEWGGRESVGSDVDMDDLEPTRNPAGANAVLGRQIEAEEAPNEVDIPTARSNAPEDAELGDQEPKQTQEQSVHASKLRDLFAPREEEAGFSLLGHLDLDLELDDDVVDPSSITGRAVHSAPVTVHSTPLPSQTTSQAPLISLDSRQPFFFPLSADARSNLKGKVRDPFGLAKEKGWDWRDFHRTDSAEEIKQRWEERKGDLTQDWKRRHREAIKSRRRRGGGDGGD